MKQIKVNVVDVDGVYRAIFESRVLGNRYDHNATKILIEAPRAVKDSDLRVVFKTITGNESVLINLGKDREFDVPNTITAQSSWAIGFYFTDEAGVSKNTKTAAVFFVESPTPDGEVFVDYFEKYQNALKEIESQKAELNGIEEFLFNVIQKLGSV